MTRWIWLIGSAALCSLSVPAAHAQSYLESNTDRDGPNYRSFDIATNSPDKCAAACLAEDQCQAFTFAAPGKVAPAGRCFLKSSAPAAAANSGCTSGLKSNLSGVRTNATLEANMDRDGANYRSFDIATNTPDKCAAACMAEDQCKAFTFAAPGKVAPTGRCFLKPGVPGTAANQQVTSGVKPTALLGGTTAPTPSAPKSIPAGTTDLNSFAGESCTLYNLGGSFCSLQGTCTQNNHVNTGADAPGKAVGSGAMGNGTGFNTFGHYFGIVNGNKRLWVRVGASKCSVEEGMAADGQLTITPKTGATATAATTTTTTQPTPPPASSPTISAANAPIKVITPGLVDLSAIFGVSCALKQVPPSTCALQGDCTKQPLVDRLSSLPGKDISSTGLVTAQGFNFLNKSTGMVRGNRRVWITLGTNSCGVQDGAYADQALKMQQKK